MPEPVKSGTRYMPGLDGLRAIAVAGVVAYHLGFEFLPGGLLGVGVFFTLSGYLITDLLLAQIGRGGIKLKSFWLARARRLLPALFVMLIVVMAWVTVIGPHQPPDFRTAAGTAAAYFNNWWLIFRDASYFAQFEAPGPLSHLWSLSIEEQFYIVWPFLLMLGVRFIPDVAYSSGVRFRLGMLTLGLALVSGLLMVLLYDSGIDPSRVYYGTDTRALELLVGAALAMTWPSRRLKTNIPLRAARIIDGAGILGLGVIALMFLRTDELSPFLYRGGFLVLAIATALVVAAVAHPASRLGPTLGWGPLRWIGERSYGIYLWHLPIIILTTPEGAREPDLGRAAAQVAATIAVAAISWRFLEDPIRHGALRRIPARIRAGKWSFGALAPRARIAVAGGAAICLAAMLGFAGIGDDPSKAQQAGDVNVAETATEKRVNARKANSVICDSVVHIGDSTSEGLVSPEFLSTRKRISKQYARVGATTRHLEVSGARSIVERFEGNPNAQDVAESWKEKGFDGCWVLALGTNETANVAAGSKESLNKRINRMMSLLRGEPVLWVNVRTTSNATGPYVSANMRRWNTTLLDACRKYPNMRIYDWASEVRDEWFIPDGIHFTPRGYAARGRRIANALRGGFPASQPDVTKRSGGSSCVVGSRRGP